MADSSIEEVLDRITCSLCQELFKEPKKLPCDHVYCKECLRGLSLRSLNATISCPECHAVAQVPNNNVDIFQNSFHGKRRLEPFQHMKPAPNCQARLAKTNGNPSHQLRKGGNNSHEKPGESPSTTKEDGTAIWLALSKVSEAEAEIAKQEKELQDRVDRAFEHTYFSILDKSKKNLKRSIAQKYRFSADALASQREQLVALQKENTKLMEVIERSQQNGSERRVLSKQESIERRIEKVRDKVKRFTVDTPKAPRHQVKLMGSQEFQQFLDKSNSLCAEEPVCYIKDAMLQGESYSLILHSDGKKLMSGTNEVKATLRSIRDDFTVAGKLESSEGRLKVVFKSQRCGRHELSITLNGKHVVNSPFSVLIHKPPERMDTSVAAVENLQFPVRMVQFKERVLVAEIRSDRIVELTSDFKVDGVFKEKLKGPLGLATDSDMNVYVSTTRDHRIHKFASDGRLVKSVGGLGTKQSQFNFPNGLRISKREELYVCDSQNDRIQTFGLDLKFKGAFGTHGSGEGEFHFPSDVDFDTEGNVYVADQLNHRIQVFTRDHHFHAIIDHSPVAIYIINDFLYSSSYSRNQVAVYKVSGKKFVKYIGSDVLSCPQGIFFDLDEFMYVTSHDSKIFVF